MTTPAWQAPINGAQNNLNAVDASADLNQFLGVHAINEISYGTPVVRPTNGTQGFFTHTGNLATQDFAQAFTMSGTSIGRITVPIKTFGNGADVLFTLCPDNGGNPNTSAPICQVKVPATVLNATGAQLGLENATLPWQAPYNNTQFATNFSPTIPWNSPAATVHGSPSFFATCTSGNYSLLLGGFDSVGSTASAACFTVLYTGAGTIASPIPQPNLPQGTFQAAATTTADTVVFMGGTTGAASTVNNVWAASWNSSTGVIGAWSSQTALPTATTNGMAASSGSTIYYVGGNTANTIASGTSNVYIAQVSNNQVGSWIAGPPIPHAVSLPFVAAINGWLVVAGGVDTSNTARAETYYSAIGSDGSLGPWQTGPMMFQAVGSAVPSWGTGITTSSLILYVGTVTGGGLGTYIQQLSVMPSGVAPSWNVFKSNTPGTVAMSAFTDGNGIWYLMGYNTNNTAAQNFVQAVPVTSVPLYATGLSNGATYWVVIQEVESANASDYTGVGLNFSAYGTDAKNSARHQNSWSTYIGGTSVPLTVYDTTAGALTIHTTEDLASGVNSALYEKWTTYSYGQNNLLNGIIEVTMQPNNALNSNPTFTSGTSPWTVTNGTLTQSNVQTHGGFPFSGLLTPTGGFASAFVSTEQFPAGQTPYGSAQWYLATGFFYSTTGWANFAVNVNWYDSSGTFISTSSGANVSLAANTWTQVSSYVTPPSTAAFATMVPTQSASPGATNLLYISNAYMLLAAENVGTLTSIAEVNYQSGTLWPPVGVTQLN